MAEIDIMYENLLFLAQKENPKGAWKGMFQAMKKAKCIDKGVTTGGNHGKTFMPEYLKFWKDNLL